MSAITRWADNLVRQADRLSNGRISRLKELPVGFRIDEIMTGRHRFEPGMGPEGYHPFEFQVTWGPKRIGEWLDPHGAGFLSQPLEGVVRAGGLCQEAPCQGTLELQYFNERLIRYTFDFRVDSTDYHYVGEKVNIRPWNLPVSHTTCFGYLTEARTGRLISTSVTFFRLHRMARFLSSFRIARG
ncbi:MAG: hypothetical protein JW797_17670 [Bradymonadales bacterium]|nr:hypothetical protein [Bradymonadales bacterium]